MVPSIKSRKDEHRVSIRVIQASLVASRLAVAWMSPSISNPTSKSSLMGISNDIHTGTGPIAKAMSPTGIEPRSMELSDTNSQPKAYAEAVLTLTKFFCSSH